MKKWILFSVLAFILLSCEKEKRECPGSVEKTFTQTDFSRIKAGDNFTFAITKGTAFSIKATGCQDDLDDLKLALTAGNTLEIDFKNYDPHRYRVDFVITLPEINALVLSGNAEANVTGFEGQPSVVRNILSGNANVTLTGVPVNAQVELSGNTVLNMSGSTLSLYGSVSGNATLNAYPVSATEVDILSSGNSKAFVTSIQKLFVTASGQSIVKYKGEPIQKTIEMSGNAKVIKE